MSESNYIYVKADENLSWMNHPNFDARKHKEAISLVPKDGYTQVEANFRRPPAHDDAFFTVDVCYGDGIGGTDQFDIIGVYDDLRVAEIVQLVVNTKLRGYIRHQGMIWGLTECGLIKRSNFFGSRWNERMWIAYANVQMHTLNPPKEV